jgi:hypothetical protein
LRQKEKVTHQGSPDPSGDDLLPPRPNEQVGNAIQLIANHSYCHFCGNGVSKFLRIGFLRDSHHDTS